MAVLLLLALPLSGTRAGVGWPGYWYAVNGVALASEGKIVVAGFAIRESRVFVARYTASGSPDHSFGKAGRVLGLQIQGAVHAVAVQPDGKIVVAGTFGVLRYEASGAPDAGFVERGAVAATPAEAIALRADGRIVAADETAASEFRVAQLLPDGGLDPGFGNAGRAVADVGVRVRATAVALQADGGVVVAGVVQDPNVSPTFVLARFLPSGRLDPGFGTGGTVRTTFCGGRADAFALAAMPDGRLVAAGATGPDADLALARYLPDGELDPSFGSGGRVMSGGGLYGQALALTPEGAILVAGNAVLARFRPDGAPDTSFGLLGRRDTRILVTAIAADEHNVVVAAHGPALAGYRLDGSETPGFLEPWNPPAELRAFPLKGGSPRTLRHGIAEGAAMGSPDGKQVAFLRDLDGRLELDVAPRAGGPLRTLVRSPFDGYQFDAAAAVWSPDGSRIAFTGHRVPDTAACLRKTAAGDASLFVVSLRDGTLRRLASNATAPVWSPDSRWLLYTPSSGYAGELQRIYLVGVADGHSRQIAAGMQPAWSPDGRRIAFVDQVGNLPHIAVSRADGRGLRLLTVGQRPIWSPNGRWLAYARDCGPNGRDDCIQLIRPDGRQARQLAHIAATKWLAWTPDATRLIAVGRRVTIIPLHDRPHQLVLGRLATAGPPSVTPNSQTLLLPVTPPRPLNIAVAQASR